MRNWRKAYWSAGWQGCLWFRQIPYAGAGKHAHYISRNLIAVSVAGVRPVLFGNKENNFSCICDGVYFVLAEAQSSVSPNIPYRLLEYAVAGLRATVDSEQLLYGRTRVYFPVPKLYVLQVGLEAGAGSLPEKVQYDVRLSGLQHMSAA